MTKPQVLNIKKVAKDNDYFREVLVTGTKSQVVLMSLEPGEEIGTEVHEVDQVIYVVEGKGEVVIDGAEEEFEKGVLAFIPAGAQHNVLNTNDKAMKLFTIYAPPQHAPGTVHRTRSDADRAEARSLEPARA
jgi:mannose-6-phosphate isomerase-like protein (cupin superfamily)